jgi:ubiquinone/menaquinone biosynthesis C-methylase UbiE
MSDDQRHRFSGSVPEFYDTFMVPMFFEPYADDLVQRLRVLPPRSVLEVASGTGVLTRAMAAGLPASTEITATDLSQDMIDRGEAIGTGRTVTWQQADVTRLPFDDGCFGAVVCQFGAMFFPDRAAAFREMARVLEPGGVALISTWDSLATNEFAATVHDTVAARFPDDPPAFFPQTPHGYFDEATIQADLRAGGFDTPAGFDVVDLQSTAPTARAVAVALCQGTPLRAEIEARSPGGLDSVTDAATEAVAARFGASAPHGAMRAFVVTARTT